MPQIQNPNDPIWDNKTKRIIPVKFGIRDLPELKPCSPPRKELHKLLLQKFAALPALGRVFIISNKIPLQLGERKRSIPFTLQDPVFGVVTGAGEHDYTTPDGELGFRYYVKILWATPECRQGNYTQEELVSFMREAPSLIANQTVLSRKNHESYRRTETTTVKRLNYMGPAVLSFAALPDEFIRIARSHIIEVMECVHGIPNMNLLSSPSSEPAREAPLTARPARGFRGLTVPSGRTAATLADFEAACAPTPAPSFGYQPTVSFVDSAVSEAPPYNPFANNEPEIIWRARPEPPSPSSPESDEDEA